MATCESDGCDAMATFKMNTPGAGVTLVCDGHAQALDASGAEVVALV